MTTTYSFNELMLQGAGLRTWRAEEDSARVARWSIVNMNGHGYIEYLFPFFIALTPNPYKPLYEGNMKRFDLHVNFQIFRKFPWASFIISLTFYSVKWTKKQIDFEAHRIFFGTFVIGDLVLLVHKFLTFFWANIVN